MTVPHPGDLTPLTTGQLATHLAARQPIQSASFAEADWNELPAEDATFQDCLFEAAAFTSTLFSGARFLRCRFLRCRFSHTDLQQAAFEDCTFHARDHAAEGCTFLFANLHATRFLRTDLSMAVFDRSELFDIAMDHCTLRGARFHKADFSHAYSRKVIATRATFRACNFELADLTGLRLPGCDLTASRFREADLTGADLTGTTLRDADLFQATLTNAHLAAADLRGADISGLALAALASHAGLKITQGQQHILLEGLHLLMAVCESDQILHQACTFDTRLQLGNTRPLMPEELLSQFVLAH